MAAEKKASIMKREPGELKDAEGWSKLSKEKQARIEKRTNKLREFGGVEVLAAINGGMELLEIERDLDGEEMTMTTYLQTVYGGSDRAGWRKLGDTRQLLQFWPPDVVQFVGEKGALLLRGATGAGLKDFIRVAKELPAPEKHDQKTLEGFVQNDVREKLREHKSERSLKSAKSEQLTKDEGKKLAFNSIRRVTRQTKGLTTPAQKLSFLEEVMGWLADELGIAAIRAKRITVPEGMVAKRGFPKGKKRKPRMKKAA